MDTDDDRDPEMLGLMEDLLRLSGHDFRNYAAGSRGRRISGLIATAGLADLPALRAKVRDDPAWLDRVLGVLSVPATTMFRDPEVYRAIRTLVVPYLATFPIIRVWLAGCATGEEAWSLAILLHEEGLYHRSRLYATDMNTAALATAQAGIFPITGMQEYTRNYQLSGGRDFSRYYTAAYGSAKLDAGLKRNIVFAPHNLAIDGSFNEFHLVLCRNVMIYFDKVLQARTHALLHDSLAHLGVLCLGITETIRGTPHAHAYQPIDAELRLYRKIATPSPARPAPGISPVRPGPSSHP
jgi:chemotaxis protein methyltransferase CheR